MSFGKWSRPRVAWLSAIVLLLITLTAVAFVRVRSSVEVAEVPFSDLLRDLERGAISQVAVNGDTLTFTLASGQTLRTTAPANYVTANPAFISDLAKRNVRIDVRTASEQSAYSYLAPILGLAFLGLLGVALYRVTTGRIPALESKTRTADPGATPVTFADVAGVDEAKEEVKEIVDFLREPSRFSAIGGRIPKGVLLVGPPGTGKTLLARSMAGEAKVPFLFASGSDFVEMYAGVGASRIRRLFKDARRHRLVHRLHRRARRRGTESRRHVAQPRRARADAQSASRRDGRLRAQRGHCRDRGDESSGHSRSGAAAPGRFDRQVTVGAPDVKGREQILRIHAPEGGARSGCRPAADRARHARVLGRGPGEPDERGRALRGPEWTRGRHRRRSGRGARQSADGCGAPVARR